LQVDIVLVFVLAIAAAVALASSRLWVAGHGAEVGAGGGVGFGAVLCSYINSLTMVQAVIKLRA
jgi:hypothetical protein